MDKQDLLNRRRPSTTLKKARIAINLRPTPERTPPARGKPLIGTGETLPEEAEITLKQEKEVL